MKPWPALLIALLLPGCGRAPLEGQVLARVDGTEITHRDVLTELDATRTGEGQAQIDVVLDTLIRRQLLVEEARRQGLERMPGYLASLRRDRALLLVDELARQQTNPAPSEEAISGYIRAHPYRFAQRHILLVASISVPAGPRLEALLGSAKSIDDAEARLRGRGATFDATRSVVDTGTMAPGAADALMSAAQDGPSLKREGNSLTITAVSISMPIPVSGAEAHDEARTMLADQAATDALDRLATALASQADIGRAGPARTTGAASPRRGPE